MIRGIGRRTTQPIVGAVLAVSVIVGGAYPAVGSGPSRERLAVDFSEVNTDLSDACGVEVQTRAQGSVTWSPYPEPWVRGMVLRINVNILWTLSAGENAYRVREARVSLIRIKGDGTWISMDAGSSLGGTGIVKGDFTAGQIIMARWHSRDFDRICDILTS
jgi:hypothetical protein